MKQRNMLRWLSRRWKWLLWVLAAAVSLVVFGVLCRGDRNTIDDLTDQTAYARWETVEKPYGQAAVYLQEGDAIPFESLSSIRLAVETALTAGSVPSEDYPWFFAASRTEAATLTGDKTTSNVELTLIDGAYFRIHPMKVRYGWYMDPKEVMRDRIVLDRQTAWELFSSDNVAGQFLTWNGQRYQVAAVVDYGDGEQNALASEGVNRAWTFSDSPGVGEEQGGFTCLEMVLPQPVKNFAVATMQSALKDLVPEDTEYIDSAQRFSKNNRWTVLRQLGTRGITNKGVYYPWYENAAKLAENRLAQRLIPEGICLGFSILSLLIWLILLNKRRTWGLFSLREAVENAIDRKRQRDFLAKQSEEREI